MAGLNSAQIRNKARGMGVNLSDSQVQSILKQAWDQSQYGADEGKVNSILQGMRGSSSNGGSSNQDYLRNQSAEKLKDEIANTISDLESQLNNIPGVSLSQAEMDNFLQKAINQVTPYYDKKKAEIEKGIKEGKIRTAEDLLYNIQAVKQDTENLLAKYDIRQAQNSEELANTLADITSRKGEDLALSRNLWTERLNTAKTNQVQSGILTSGIGKKVISNLLGRRDLEQQAIERRAASAETGARTTYKYNLEDIQQARKAVEEARNRKIGTPDQTLSTVNQLRGTLGYNPATSSNDLFTGMPSREEELRLRAERNQPVYSPTALTNLGEEKMKAIESRKLNLQGDELAVRREAYRNRRQSILNRIADQRARLSSYA